MLYCVAMTPGLAILSAAVTVFALVLSIFGASWLNQRNTEKIVEQLGQRLDQRINSVEHRLDRLEGSIDQRFAEIGQRLDRIERHLEAIFKPMLPK